ncbi:ankyrin repeat-containing domain protein [Rhypophila decipiens]|uniref:Ankyrin repeat-containing domain protein n=1 Tax=Rhypophila decipiens TaxID=261697 RepID=A0AAN7B8Q0_9PEZI|nr:ankyrin repeat-containing domain protein [Rhypophila decipiens]
MSSPSLGYLPDELGLEVLKYLDQVPDIAHLALTCRKHFRMADPILYDKAVARLEEEDTKPRLDNDERNYSIPFKLPPLIWGAQQGLQTTIQKALLAKDCLTRVHVEVYPTLEDWKSTVRQNRRKARNRLKPSDDSAHLRPAFRPYPTYQIGFSSLTDTQQQEEFFEDRPTVTGEAAYQGRPVKAEMTALHVAAQNASPELLAFLLDHFEAIQAPVNMGVRVKLACGCARPLPLSNWVEENSAEAWENSEWGDPNGHASNLDETDCTPLHLALCAGQKDNAKLLITRGANFAYRAKLLITRDDDDPFAYHDEFHDEFNDHMPFSSFHFAAASGQLDVLKAMVENSGESFYRLRDVLVWELSPLYHAIANGHWDTTVPYLLELEGTRSINRLSFIWFHWYNDPGEDPYMYHTSLLAEFCRLGSFEEASKILDQRDLKLLREQDESYSDRYELGLEEEPINALEISVSPSDFPRVPFLHLCCMNSLRGAGADWAERQVSDLTMETFQEKWRPVVIKKLIALGLNPNFGWALPDDPGSTPLIVAARHGNLGTINALLNSGADVQAINEKGHNALMAAMMQRTRSGAIDKADANEF